MTRKAGTTAEHEKAANSELKTAVSRFIRVDSCPFVVSPSLELENWPLEIIGITSWCRATPTRGFTAAVSVFRGTPPGKPVGNVS